MSQSSNVPAGFIGCDVGKAAVVVFDGRGERTINIPNRPQDLADFAAQLDDTCLVVCEATGGHEALLLAALVEAGIPCHRADARKVKAFIRSFGILGKTDAIDARALASYGKERHAKLARWQAPDEHRDQLQSLVLTRRDLVAQRTAGSNRLSAPGAQTVKPYLEAVLDCLNAQIKAIEAAIESLIRNHKPLDTANKAIRGLAGIGATTAASLLALMPELGRIDRRKAAALAGLAPHPNQSSIKDAYRPVRGGRPEIKRVLFMAALSATKHNPNLRAFYEKLLAKGKKPLVALTAVSRKLIVICNAMIRETACAI